MGREVRMVPKDWVHPTYINPYRGEELRPMHDSTHEDAVAEWEADLAKWDKRECEYMKPVDYEGTTFEEEYGSRPDPRDYMPNWKPEERTHLMMYENTSEGTPISPAFPTPEELARWLADNNASAFAGQGATYEQWLSTCKSGWAPSAIIAGGRMMSGVEGGHNVEKAEKAEKGE
jgi:hypothetical protein